MTTLPNFTEGVGDEDAVVVDVQAPPPPKTLAISKREARRLLIDSGWTETGSDVWRYSSSGHVISIDEAARRVMRTKEADPTLEIKIIRPIRASKRTVGRNDLCPCKSGKKFKRCCENG